MGDEELVKRIGQGDEAAAEELIRRYYPSVFRYCRCHCSSRETAEDLTQETFLRLYKSLPEYREEGKLRAYIFLIARRLCIDESRKRPLYHLEEGNLLADPADPLRRMEDENEIQSLLERLPPEQREAVVLRFGEGLRFSDIGRITGCTAWTARGRVRCALRTMRKGIGHD